MADHTGRRRRHGSGLAVVTRRARARGGRTPKQASGGPDRTRICDQSLLITLPDMAAYPRADMSLLIRTAYFTGAHSSGLLGLRANAVDRKRGWIAIRSRHRRGDEDIRKTDSSIRNLPLADCLANSYLKSGFLARAHLSLRMPKVFHTMTEVSSST